MSSVEIKFSTKVQEFFDLLLKNVKEDFLLTGGAIHDLLQGKKPKDYDVVVTSLSEVRQFLKQQKNILVNENNILININYKHTIFEIHEPTGCDLEYTASFYNIRQKSLTIVPYSNFMNHHTKIYRLTKNIRKGYKTPQDLKKKNQEKSWQEKEQVVSIRQISDFMSDNHQIILKKLKERLYIMKKLKYHKIQTQIQISQETMDIFVPLAACIGSYKIKTELENIAFMYIYPHDYKDVALKLSTRNHHYKNSFLETKEALQRILQEIENLPDITNIEINGRIKEIYSLWKKFKSKFRTNENEKLDLDMIHDVIGFRIVISLNESYFESKAERKEREIFICQQIAHLVCRFLNNDSNFICKVKDYISRPKINGYQSLHIIICRNNQVLEIQIRTNWMHINTELGLSAHWIYKGYKINNLPESLYQTALIRYVNEYQQQKKQDELTLPISQYELELKKNYKKLSKEFNFHDKRNFEKMEIECFGHVRTKEFFYNEKVFFIRKSLCDFEKLSYCCILCERKEDFEKYEPYLPNLYMLYLTNHSSYMIYWLENYRLCLLKACNIEIDMDFVKTEKDFDIHYHFKTIEQTLFLDIDGVLSNDGQTIDETLLEHFAPLIPNSNIVITSKWRRFPHKKEILTQLLSNCSIHFTENKNPFFDSVLEIDWKLPNNFFQQTISTQYNIMKKIYKNDIPYKELCEHLEDFEIKFDKFLMEKNIPYEKNKKTIFEILRDANSNVMVEYVIENGHSEQLIKILPKKYISDDSQLIYDEFLKIKTCEFSFQKVLPILSFENKMLWKLEFYAEIHRWIPRKQHVYIRELEIQEYMRKNVVGKYVIIDDLPMTDKEHFISCETSPFSRDHATQVEEILQKQDDFIQDISFEISNGYFFQRSEYSKTLFEIDDDMISCVQPYLGNSSQIWLETVYQDFYNKHEVFWQQFYNVNPSCECLKFIINKYFHQ